MAKRAATKDSTPDVIDVGEQNPDEQLARSAGQEVVSFFPNMRNFFLKARVLETTALELLDQAKAWRVNPPTNEKEDLQLQGFIRRTSEENKNVVSHWAITKTIHAFHKSMTTKRGIAESALEAANKTGNELHAAYKKAEEKKAAEENARRQAAAEAEAQKARDAELAAAEEEAVRREAALEGLSPRETLFVDLMFSTGNSVESAKRAGFKNALKESTRLLTQPKICDALEAKRSAAVIRQQAAATKAAPLMVEDVERAAPAVSQAAGSYDRKTRSAELLDETALIEAIFAGKYGIPRTLLRIDTTALNAQARDLGELINRWPGVRFKETNKVI